MSLALNYLFSSESFFVISQFLLFEVFPGFISLLTAPLSNPSMFWIIVPLLLSLILTQLYFARNSDEEGSWDNLFGNSVSLIFVSINLLQFLVTNTFDFSKLVFALIICLISTTQLIINYFHLINRKIAFIINSEISTNVTAYLAIIFVYSSISLTFANFVAAAILFTVLFFIFEFIKSKIPKSREAVRFEKERHDEAIHQRLLSEKLNLRQEHLVTARINDAIIVLVTVIILSIILNFLSVPLIISALIASGIFIVLIYYLMNRDKLKFSTINYDNNLREWLYGVLLGVPLFVVITGFSLLIPQISNNESLIVPGLITPVITEVLFRGLVLRSLKSKYASTQAVIIQSLIYTIACFNLSNILMLPVIFVAGIILGFFREKWGLESAISAHLVFNIIGLII